MQLPKGSYHICWTAKVLSAFNPQQLPAASTWLCVDAAIQAHHIRCSHQNGKSPKCSLLAGTLMRNQPNATTLLPGPHMINTIVQKSAGCATPQHKLPESGPQHILPIDIPTTRATPHQYLSSTIPVTVSQADFKQTCVTRLNQVVLCGILDTQKLELHHAVCESLHHQASNTTHHMSFANRSRGPQQCTTNCCQAAGPYCACPTLDSQCDTTGTQDPILIMHT